ncbi:MAG: methyltransferase domain-containing protein [Candidatus Helarchaeota archaeon]
MIKYKLIKNKIKNFILHRIYSIILPKKDDKIYFGPNINSKTDNYVDRYIDFLGEKIINEIKKSRNIKDSRSIFERIILKKYFTNGIKLDIGIGTRPKLINIFRRNIISIDITKRSLINVRIVYPDMDFINCDATFLPIKDNYIENIYCGGILSHIHNIYRYKNELFRILKDNGYCYLTESNEYWYDINKFMDHMWKFNIYSILNYITKEQFSIEIKGGLGLGMIDLLIFNKNFKLKKIIIYMLFYFLKIFPEICDFFFVIFKKISKGEVN